ncbi:glutathione-dependent formaldehyde-activating enzyme [Paramyrothecium foliicola]|nr:glutathione-dependent formaldehyde-activating enzyme [Paramyrothecium foliicola]
MAESEAPTTPRQTRSGSCHCGAFAYEFEAPEIKSVTDCNCSICTKKGYLWAFVGENDKLTIVKGDDGALKDYTFGQSQAMVHKFCPTCGTAVMATIGPSKAINVHSIQDIDSWSLEKNFYDGAAIGSPYEPPAHKGPLPETREGEKVYTGSCHCGALTVAVASKPLDETYPERVSQCNCSLCERNAAVWIYSTQEQVVLSGDKDNIGEYSFNFKLGYKTFCKICGVTVSNNMRKLSDEELAAIPEKLKGFVEGAWKMHPVNIRVLHGVDLKKLNIGKTEGRKF